MTESWSLLKVSLGLRRNSVEGGLKSLGDFKLFHPVHNVGLADPKWLWFH